MEWIDVEDKKRHEYNNVVNHPLQSYEWGEFRKKTGVGVIRRALIKNGKIVDGFSLTIHNVPKTRFKIGYLPKGNKPTKELLTELERLGKDNNCVFIQLEPNVLVSQSSSINSHLLRPSFHPLFTKFTFILDISKNEDELLKSFHSKTRYNIKVAQKHGVTVSEKTSDKDFEEYLKLTRETTTRQKFYAHSTTYHSKMWQTLGKRTEGLSAHLFTAVYQKQTLVSWILFIFNDTLYYPYGASSSKNRNVMASNLIMWEAIKYGKSKGLKKFDMWGALGKDPNPNDPWFGFHKFKEGYGATHTEFVGSFDLIINPLFYQVYKATDKIRWLYLRIKKGI